MGVAPRLPSGKTDIVKEVIRNTTVNIGYGGGTYSQTVDVKSKLPKLYTTLTLDNFAIQLTSFYMGASTSWPTLSIIDVSYSPTTGVLAYKVRYTGAASDSKGTYKDTIYCFHT